MKGRENKARALFSAFSMFEWSALALGVFFGCLLPLTVGGVLSTDSLPGAPRSDFEYYFYPLRCFLARVWKSGTVPLWNPHLFCGYPVIECVQSAVLYPLNALGLNLSPAEAIVYLTATHLLLNYAAWWLAFRNGFGFSLATSSVTAALANVSALLPYRFFAGHLTIIFAFPWIPLLGAAAYRVVRSESFCRPWWHVAALCTALLFTAGAPQFALFGFYGALVIALANAMVVKSVRGVLRVGLALILGSVLALPQITATLDYISFSARQGSWGTPSSSAGFWATIVETLLPAPLGDGITEIHVNERGVWDTAGYFGAIALVSALVWGGHNLRRGIARNDPRALTALALLCLGVYLMRGAYLPGFESIRENQRAVVLVHFSALLFVALFLDSMSGSQSTVLVSPKNWWGYSATFFAAVAALIPFQQFCAAQFPSLLTWIIHHCLGKLTFSPAELSDVAAYLFTTFQRSFNWIVAWLTLAAFCVFVARYRSCSGWLIFATLMLLDPLLLHIDAYRFRTPLSNLRYPPGLETALISSVEHAKKRHHPPCRFVFSTSLTNIAQCTDGVWDSGGYDPLMPALALARRSWFTGDTSPETRQQATFRALAVCGFLEEPRHQPEFVPLPQRIIFLRHVPCAGAVAELVTEIGLQPGTYLFGPLNGTTHTVESHQQLDWLRKWLTDNSHPANPKVTIESGDSAKVRWYHVANPNRLWLSCFSESPRLLVIHTTWLPGWRATIETARGVRTQALLRCNGWMIGCPVASSYSFVRLEYVPSSWRLALFLSLIALMVLIASALTSFQVLREPRE